MALLMQKLAGRTVSADIMPDRKAVYPVARNGAKAILDGVVCDFSDGGAGDLATGNEA